MLLIGSHVGFNKDKQILGSLEEALSYDANTFMIYTGAPQNTRRNTIDQNLVKQAKEKMNELGYDYKKIIVHAPYIVNLANDDPEKYQFSIQFLKQEVKRVEELGLTYLVIHPGNHIGLGKEKGIENIVNALNEILNNTNVVILLETMSGKGTEIGSNFLELKKIIDGVNCKPNIGVCMDTCHLHDAGYDLENFDDILKEFDELIGLDYLKCIHINDSKNERDAHKDRHENFGFGYIGFNTLINIAYHEKLVDIPKILETPYVEKLFPPYKYEIEMIRKKEYNDQLKLKIQEMVNNK